MILFLYVFVDKQAVVSSPICDTPQSSLKPLVVYQVVRNTTTKELFYLDKHGCRVPMPKVSQRLADVRKRIYELNAELEGMFTPQCNVVYNVEDFDKSFLEKCASLSDLIFLEKEYIELDLASNSTF